MEYRIKSIIVLRPQIGLQLREIETLRWILIVLGKLLKYKNLGLRQSVLL
jgi:hypothetical protein